MIFFAFLLYNQSFDGKSFLHHDLSIYSNDGSGLFRTSFKPSPIMSTYLVAFAVSDFTYIDNSKIKQPDEPLQRIIISEDAIEKADFALETSVAALKALENYTGFKYDLEKLDSIMVPGKGGAMENW